MIRTVTVLGAGPATTVQDGGRRGNAHLGVPRSGWLDGESARLANRLVGNPEDSAVLECLLGALRLRADSAVTVAITGARCTVRAAGRPAGFGVAVTLRAGDVVELGVAPVGLRCWVALSGGVGVPSELGSRATDTLSGLGPPVVRDGTVLPLGVVSGVPGSGEVVREVLPPNVLHVHPGPRADWFEPDALRSLCAAPYAVQPDSDRVALRLSGTALRRTRHDRLPDELPSEGLVLGAVQVPPDGQPIVFLADHPTTGGYPVVAVLDPDDVSACAQLRPGQEVSFRPARV